MKALVSIITPMYNSASTIADTIESVLSQTYTDWELLISDDLSKDESIDIVKHYQAKDSRIKLITTSYNTGPAECRNRAIKKAQGDYIAFLDADDRWCPNKLQKQVSYMQENKVALSYTSYAYMNEKGELSNKTIKVPKRTNFQQLLKSNTIPCLTGIYHVKSLGKQYMKTIGHEDYLFWLNLLKPGIEAHGITEVLAHYRIHSNTVSSNKLKVSAYQWNIYRKELKLNFVQSLYYFTWYTLLGIRKHYI